LAVHSGGLAVGIGFILVGIEHLDFVEAHQEHATVAALLAIAVRRRRLAKLDV
jgi:hypothetical protein